MIDTSGIRTRMLDLEAQLKRPTVTHPGVVQALRQQLADVREDLRLAEGVKQRIERGPA